ncbi:coiled-coil domain-containing protein 14 [Larimichthys crocea]|uniref:coiled-coil domain-containing protein 14 n=1 Tax=Larimichthys crocea TaxID=215358 RepID=UPI0009013260|nr:coiled-coil domain-containing protein 14 [Larimichthys crocea]
MDVAEENKTSEEMLEKIAELEYSQNMLRDLNAQMRHWLEVADEELAMLRSENATLKKQLKDLEKFVNEAQQVEAEPISTLLADELDAKRSIEKKIEKLEKESTVLKEQNKKLSAELKSSQQEDEQDKITLSKLRATQQTLKHEIEEDQIELQHRDDVIHKLTLQIKHMKETEDEYLNITQDLRLTNQKLRNQLEDRQDQASFANLNDLMEEREGSPSPPLSFAEEIKLLASLTEVKSSNSTDLKNEDTEAKELLKSQSLAVKLHTERCQGVLGTVVKLAGLFALFVFLVFVLGTVALANCEDMFDNSWRGLSMALWPYCNLHYVALPPF